MEVLSLDFAVSIENLSVEVRIDYRNEPHNIKPTSYTMHEHAVTEVYFIENGSMILQCADQNLELSKQDILIIPANTLHRVISCTDDLKRFNFRFLIRDYQQVWKEPFIFFRPEPLTAAEISQSIDSIHHAVSQNTSPLSSFRFKAHFSVLLSYIIEKISAAALNPQPNMFLKTSGDSVTDADNKLAQYIQIDTFFDKHYADQPTIEDLVRELNYSKRQVGRILQQYAGMTFSEKLLQTRLTAALSLLTNTTLTIDEIAEKCGYSTRKGFELMFRKHTGISPSCYRKKL